MRHTSSAAAVGLEPAAVVGSSSEAGTAVAAARVGAGRRGRAESAPAQTAVVRPVVVAAACGCEA